MGDLAPRCVKVAVPQPSAQADCPENTIKVFVEQPDQQLFISADDFDAVGAIGATAVLMPWLVGRALATIVSIIDERLNNEAR